MHPYRNLPLRHKLTILSLVTTTVAMLLACVGFVAYELLTFKQELVGDAATAAEMIGYNSASALSFNDAKSAEQTLQGLSAQSDIIAACIYDKEGRVFATYPSTEPVASFGPPVREVVDRFGSDRLEIFRPIRVGGEEIGTIYVRSDFREVRERIRQLAWIVGVVMVVAMLGAYFLAARLQRIISAPVSELAAIVGRVGVEKDFSIRAVKHGDDELGRLIDGFNEMLAQIQARDRALQEAQSGLEQRVALRTTELAQSLSLLSATLESTADGIVVIDGSGRITSYNAKFAAMWRLTDDQIAQPVDDRMVAHVAEQLKDGEAFLAKVRELSNQPEAESHDVLEMKDGRVFERDSQPQRLNGVPVGRVWCFRDITERTRADTDLRWKTAVLEAQVDSSPDGILIVDAQRNRILQNRLFGDLWNVPREIAEHQDTLRQVEFVRTQAKDPETLAKKILHLYAHPDETSRDEIELKDGTVLDRHSSPVRGKDGVNYGRIWTVRDITDRKRAESKLAEASGLLEALLANSPDSIYFKDRESRFVRFSRAVTRRFPQQAPDWLTGKSDADLFSPEHAVPAYRDEQEIMRTGVPIVGKLEKETPSHGPATWALTTKMPWRDGTGAIVGTFGISKDVTALKDTEAKLAYERDQLRALLDSSPDVIYFKDTQSRFTLVSRSKVQATIARVPDLRARRTAHGLAADVPEGEILTGLTDFDTFGDDEARVAYEDEQKIVRTGEPVVGKLEKQTFLDGTTLWSLTSKMPWLDPAGKIIGTFGISKDISDLKATEAKLEATHRQLLQTSREAGMAEVATGVLHNVGNVLNSVNVSATLVADHVRHTKAANVAKIATLLAQHQADLAGFLTKDPRGQMIPGYLGTLAESLAEEHKVILQELDHLRKNIEHIKDIVSMQQTFARTSGVTETVSVPDLIDDALRINAGSLERHAIATIREYQARPVITTDKHKVMQVLINLVGNAKYACDESGRSDKKITVRITHEGHAVRIAVIDNGIGIPAENLTRIFNHGFTTKKTGHGFGLHSGALAARELGGSLSVESGGRGQGATFIFELPGQPETRAA